MPVARERFVTLAVVPEIPRQLPLSIREFTGRTEQLAALDKLIDDGSGRIATTNAVVISAVDGAAGIGKTALAVHWAHRVQHRFPDGTLYMNLRGYGPGDPAAPAEVLDGFLRALGVRADALPQSADAQSARYRSLLAGRKVLIVLDNANDAEQVRPLLPGAPGCVVVVTSRGSLTGLVVTESASRLTLDLLSPEESIALVREILGPGRDAIEPEAVQELVLLCARLPLALRIAASRVSTGSVGTVTEVVAELADDRSRLDALSWDMDERAAIRSVFEWSYEKLSADEARLFRHLGLHVGPEFSLHAAAAIADLPLPSARRLLRHLESVHLVEPGNAGRYRMHDLLHTYAAERAHQHDSAAARDEARKSLITWYTSAAVRCDELVFPGFTRLPDRPVIRLLMPPISDRAQALSWLEAEQSNLLAALNQAARHELDTLATHLTDSLAFLNARGRREKRLDTLRAGLTVAQRAGDRRAECSFYLFIGEAFTSLQKWDDAHENNLVGLSIARELADRRLEVFGLSDRGVILFTQHRFDESHRYLQEALVLMQDLDIGRFEAVVHGNLSTALHGLGRYRQALAHGEIELVIRRRVGDLDGESGAFHHLARAKQGLGYHEEAISLCRKAIAIGRQLDLNLDLNVAGPLDTLARSLHHSGDTAHAISCWRESAALFTEYGDYQRAEEVKARLDTLETPGSQ
ncbi:ATP-binding protein [Amycolatopsis lexingtonensis]|uniref:ATP-binding protein n=1 Tax=Amycolatopsis lexingtonensis TaxID=218822 RepID=UPI003F6F5EF9